MAIYKNILDIGRSVANNIPSLLSRKNLLNYQRCAAVSSRTLEKKLGLPPKPKRPLGAFFLFSQAQRPSLTAQYPEKRMPDIVKMITSQWKELDEAERNYFREQTKEQMVAYTKDVIAYEENLTPEQREMLKAERARINNTEKKNKMKSRMRELERPKKPATPFVIFMISKLKSKPKDEPFPGWLNKIAKEWKELRIDEKEEIRNEAKKLMHQYKTDVLMWEAKMLKMGHIDVVRSRALLGLKGGHEAEKTKKDEHEST